MGSENLRLLMLVVVVVLLSNGINVEDDDSKIGEGEEEKLTWMMKRGLEREREEREGGMKV